MRLRDMELVVRVAETGSMTQAARQLHVTPAAVSGALQRVEEELGIRVFERTTRSIHPTGEGRLVIDGCRETVERWQQIVDEARTGHADLAGTVHLAAPSDTCYGIVGDVVAELSAAHPELRFVLDISDAIQPLHRDAIDLAIRYGPLADSTLAARKLVELPPILVAAPSYLERAGAPPAPASLGAHCLLTLHTASRPTREWMLGPSDDALQTLPVGSPLCGDGYMVRQWARDGRGIALKSPLDVIEDLEEGRLVRVLPGLRGPQQPIHVVFPSRRAQPARVRAVDAAIAARIQQRAARCAPFVV
ncbi:MAG: LysR family transcriptional regulator [Myxococcota bacterium]